MDLKIDFEEYFYINGLDKILDIDFKLNEAYDPEFVFENDGGEAYQPEILDLTRLHYIIRKRKILTVLEFGIGFSTLVMADAIRKNKEQFSFHIKGKIRRIDPFHIYSVEASEYKDKYAKNTIESLKKFNLDEFVDIHFSSASLTTFNERICGKFDNLPNICPDFIYVDGPNPSSIKGQINGISMNHQDRTNLTCDLLTIEPMLLPGTCILFDGLTNNARFHKNNFQRNWIYVHNEKEDYSFFELDEKPLGPYNRNQMEFQNSLTQK